jgi:hypothetical protein
LCLPYRRWGKKRESLHKEAKRLAEEEKLKQVTNNIFLENCMHLY